MFANNTNNATNNNNNSSNHSTTNKRKGNASVSGRKSKSKVTNLLHVPLTEREQYAEFLEWKKTSSSLAATPLAVSSSALGSLPTSILSSAAPPVSTHVGSRTPSSGMVGIKVAKSSKQALVNSHANQPIISQYLLSNPLNMQPSTLATVGTNQLLISRIPRFCPLPTILLDLANIGNLLGVSIDTAEFSSRWHSDSAASVFQTDENSGKPRISIVVLTVNIHEYNSAGNLRSDVLPLFIHTQKGPSSVQTSHRLSVQALPFGTPMSCSSLHEVVSFRGFPDSCHVVSALLPVLLGKVLEASGSSPILAVVQSRITPRVIQEKPIYVDESFLTFFAMQPAVVSFTRASIQVLDYPSPCSCGPWSGQMAKSVLNYRNSPTAVDELLASPLVLLVSEVSGDLTTDLEMVSKYLDLSDSSCMPSAVGYLRGNIDSPVTKVGGSCLILFPPTHGVGEWVRFNSALWDQDHPHDKVTSHHPYPGFEVLPRLYRINLEPPAFPSRRLQGGIILPQRARVSSHPPPPSLPVSRHVVTVPSLLVTTTFAATPAGSPTGSGDSDSMQVVSSPVSLPTGASNSRAISRRTRHDDMVDNSDRIVRLERMMEKSIAISDSYALQRQEDREMIMKIGNDIDALRNVVYSKLSISPSL